MIKKRDNNQADIVDTLRKCGAFVFDAGAVGRGFPDLAVCYHGRWIMMEVKAQRGKLTPEQVVFHSECGGKVYIVRTRNEAITALNTEMGRLS